MNEIIRINNITKYYKDFVAVNSVNIAINHGEIYGLIGKNGAGKTSILKMILGILNPSSGNIEIANPALDKTEKLQFGSVIEAPNLYNELSALTNLRLVSKLIPNFKDNVFEILDIVGLDKDNRKPVKTYSLGMRQRLGLAIALLGSPDILILDEPMNGLDPVGMCEFRNLLIKLNKEKNVTMIISSHLLNELFKFSNTYGVIRNGCLAKEITHNELLEMFSSDVERENYLIKLMEEGICNEINEI